MSNFENEYNAVRQGGVGILNFPSRGLIEVSGGEAVQFLNGLITNDVAKLQNNSWMLAAFPNAQGRLIALVRVLRLDDKFLFDVDAINREKILQNLIRFTFAGDFKVKDLSENFILLGIRGNNLTNLSFTSRSDKEISFFDFQGEKILFVPAFRETGFDAIVPQTQILEDFRANLETQGAVTITDEARETLRVEAGIPKYGVDVDESTIVLETGVDEAVSFNKGCYIGQEIIARIHFRGHVAKRLSGLIIEETIEIQPGDQLKSAEGKAAGRLTSTVFSPALNKQIALALVRYEFLAPETELFVVRNENQLSKAKVINLPFIK